jgi:hypothetical protein
MLLLVIIKKNGGSDGSVLFFDINNILKAILLWRGFFN